MELINEIRFGLKQVEDRHYGFYDFEAPKEYIKIGYRSVTRLTCDGLPFRDFAHKIGIILTLDHFYRQYFIEITLFGNPEMVGDAGPEVRPVHVYIQGRQKWCHIGEVPLSGKRQWETIRFRIPDEIEIGESIKVVVDNTDNFIDGVNHVHLRIHSIKVFGSDNVTKRILSVAAPDILLVLAPPWNNEMPPLGLSCIASYLQHNGVAVDVLDLNAALFNRVGSDKEAYWGMDQYYLWLDPDSGIKRANHLLQISEPYLDLVESKKPEFIGFGFYKINYYATIVFAREIRRRLPKTKLIVGGHGLLNHELSDIRQVFDYVIVGEGEEALLELIKGGGGGTGFFDAKNNSLDQHIVTHKRLVRELTNMPLYSLEKFNLANYKKLQLPGVTSRGCIFKCIYCLDHILSSPFRHYGADNVISQIEKLMKAHNLDYIYFNDLLINGNVNELERLCDLIVEKKIRIQWMAWAAIKKDMTLPVLRKMKKAGCQHLVYGAESGVLKILKAMKKTYAPGDIVTVLQHTKEAGIGVGINLMFGFPGETWNDFIESLNFIVENRGLFDNIGSITDVHVLNNTNLYLKKDEFNIQVSSDNDSRKWRGQFNDVDIRLKKCRHALSVFQKHGVKVCLPS